MTKYDRKTNYLWSWLTGFTGGNACSKNPEELRPPRAKSVPCLRFFPAQFPAPALSSNPGYVIVYCRDFQIGSCIAEAASRFGRDVYICDDLEETLELVTAAPDSFLCLLVAETFFGGDQDIEQLLSQMKHKGVPPWAFIKTPSQHRTYTADKTSRDASIVGFERSFLECCRSFGIALH